MSILQVIGLAAAAGSPPPPPPPPSDPAASITNQSVEYLHGAGINYNSSGIVTTTHAITLETWLISGTANQFDIRATRQFGTPTSGVTGSWVSLASGYGWAVSTSGLSNRSCSLLIEIRNAATLAVLTSATVDLTADGSGGL